MSLLDIQSLTAGYRRDAPVLHGVSLTADPGEFVGLVGPNGSGKTTLIRAASRSLPPSAGRVMLEGQDAWEMPSREFACRVAVVPQETAVPFDMTSLEIVLLGRHPHVGRLHLENAADEGVALAALESVNAGPLAGRSVKRISGGERQRVIIAKALAQEPRLLLMDEPTAHLDIAQQTEVMSLVARLARERNMAVVAVLHDLNLAATWCDRVVILHEGRVAANGPPAQVITEPLVARVWQARMWVKRHPATGRPYLLPMPPPYEPEEEEEGVISPLIHVVCGGG
ncbi:MAG TPA: ABC transporter ATP-binding protein, partial [Chloroflexota bacterium]|nr:ABC transporter ATP-binding protein [Chloroflexota bacterium]